jgi:MoxR-like ATPase
LPIVRPRDFEAAQIPKKPKTQVHKEPMETIDLNAIQASIQQANARLTSVKEEIGKVIVGQEDMIERLLIALLSGGHVLLEGVPGIAKTLAVTTLAQAIQCDSKRIQFTPDLLPADLIGTSIYNPREGTFSVKQGPIFTHLLLADEINRAPAKVQSALLEVMQEKQVTISGETFKIPDPYIVLATQNPIEQEGTYPLSEAQTDRFMMKVRISYPSYEEEKKILERMGTLGPRPHASPVLSAEEILKTRQLINKIYIDDKITNYLLDIVTATRDSKRYGVDIEGLLEHGASPRASLALMIGSKAHAFLAGRAYVTPHDIKSIAPDVLRHRLRLSYEAEAEELTTDHVIGRILDTINVP